MNRSILLAMCDFIILAVLSMTSGISGPVGSMGQAEMAPGEPSSSSKEWKTATVATESYEARLDRQMEEFALAFEETQKLKAEAAERKAISDRDSAIKSQKAAEAANAAAESAALAEQQQREVLAQDLRAEKQVRQAAEAAADTAQQQQLAAEKERTKAERNQHLAETLAADRADRIVELKKAKDVAEFASKESEVLRAETAVRHSKVEAETKARAEAERTKRISAEHEKKKVESLHQTELERNKKLRSDLEHAEATTTKLTAEVGEGLEHRENAERANAALDNDLSNARKEIGDLWDRITSLQSRDGLKPWAEREQVTFDTRIHISEIDGINEQKYSKFSAPLIRTSAGEHYLATSYKKLALDWGEITEDKVIKVTVTVRGPRNSPRSLAAQEIFYLNEDPRICFVQISPPKGSTCWPLFGRNLSGVPLNQLMLFKGTETGLVSSQVSIGGGRRNTLQIKNSLKPMASSFTAEEGDLLVSNDAKVIGVVVDSNMLSGQATCLVLPKGLSKQHMTKISLLKNENGKYHKAFSSGVRKLKKTIEK